MAEIDNSYAGRQDATKNVLDDIEGNMIFALEIDGIEVANFIECSGLKRSTEVVEIQEGGLNEFVHKLPGQTRWENIVLRYGVTGDDTLQWWADEVLQDEFSARRSGKIVIKRLSGYVVRRYSFQAAWPVAWEGPAFNANGADLAIEMMEIAHHGLVVELVDPSSEATA